MINANFSLNIVTSDKIDHTLQKKYIKMNAYFKKFHSTGNVNITKTEKEDLVTIHIHPEGFYAQHKEKTDEQQEIETESESSGGTMKKNKSEIEKCADKVKYVFRMP